MSEVRTLGSILTAIALLSKKVKYTVEDESVVFTYPTGE